MIIQISYFISKQAPVAEQITPEPQPESSKASAESSMEASPNPEAVVENRQKVVENANNEPEPEDQSVNVVTYEDDSQSQEAFFAEHNIDESMLPTMKPLPDEQTFGKEMALSVALEMEEKRRLTKKRKIFTKKTKN